MIHAYIDYFPNVEFSQIQRGENQLTDELADLSAHLPWKELIFAEWTPSIDNSFQRALLPILQKEEGPESKEVKEQGVISEKELNTARMYKVIWRAASLQITGWTIKVDKRELNKRLMNVNGQTGKLQGNNGVG